MLSAEWRLGETWAEWRARSVRRERLLRRLALIAGFVLVGVLWYSAMGLP